MDFPKWIPLLTHYDTLFENAENVAKYNEARNANINRQIGHDGAHECDISVVNILNTFDRVQQGADFLQYQNCVGHIRQFRCIHRQREQLMWWSHIEHLRLQHNSLQWATQQLG